MTSGLEKGLQLSHILTVLSLILEVTKEDDREDNHKVSILFP